MSNKITPIYLRSPSELSNATDSVEELTSIEICAGAGGQALGLEQAGFTHEAVVEIDNWAAGTLRKNRARKWNIVGPTTKAEALPGLPGDVYAFDATPWKGKIHLFAGGVPCPPFSMAGKQLGADDERDLFPQALRLIGECEPEAVMLENVRGLLSPKFEGYRAEILAALKELGYKADWKLFSASDFGVPQLRPRSILIALRPAAWEHFDWPEPNKTKAPTVGKKLHALMAADGWKGADDWRRQANKIAPTLVGGSKKHGGPDLGPTRAKSEWAKLGVDGMGIADAPPAPDFEGMPRLTVEMTARIQGFPASWKFEGRKTAAYRQVGNAFPPPVAKALGLSISRALVAAHTQSTEDKSSRRSDVAA